MAEAADRIREIVTFDIDPDFLRAAAIAIAWEYRLLYEQLVAGDAIPLEWKAEEFNRQRVSCVVRALSRCAKRHGIPFDFRRLECNGQNKLIIKAGRVILVQEPILDLLDHPRESAYKRELADAHSLIRQLELDLGDQPNRILDWSGQVFAVLLHGAAGYWFSERDKQLGALMLAVPDAAYGSWVMRIDITRLAVYGSQADATTDVPVKEEQKPIQEDVVFVALRDKKDATGTDQ
jgi:hypothetical protein